MKAVYVLLLTATLSCAAGREGAHPGAFEDDDPLLDRYRSENFLDLPRRSRLEAGAKYAAAPLDAPPREDQHLAVALRRFRLVARRRRAEETRWNAFHAWCQPARGLRIGGGDFVPDAGIGLVASARRFSYRFLPTHPLAANAVKPWTGFYDSFIRGGYAAVAGGPVGAFCFGGRSGTHATGGTKFDAGSVAGVRVFAAARRAAAGALVLRTERAERETNVGFDAAAQVGGGRVVFEASSGADGRFAAAWGGAFRRGGYDTGILSYNAPWRATGGFWYLPTAGTRARASKSGSAVYLRARLPARSSLLVSLARSGWRDGYRSGESQTAWVRFEVRRRAAALRLTWSDAQSARGDEIPYPPLAPVALGRTHTLETAAVVPVAAGLRLRCALRRAGSTDKGGILADASLRYTSPRAGLQLEVGGARYRSHRGRFVFRYYEPAVPGGYPWRTVSGDGERWFILCGAGTKRVRIFAGLSRQTGRAADGEAGVRMKF